MSEAFAQIGSALAGITTKTAIGAFTTGSFSYTPEALRDLITEWTDLADDYQRSLVDARRLIQVEGPGAEFVSESHANVANRSGQAYLDSLQAKYEYCVAQAQKLQNTLDDYLGVEHRNVSVINRAGPQDGI